MFENNGYHTTIDPDTAWARRIAKRIEQCKRENRPYTGPLPRATNPTAKPIKGRSFSK